MASTAVVHTTEPQRPLFTLFTANDGLPERVFTVMIFRPWTYSVFLILFSTCSTRLFAQVRSPHSLIIKFKSEAALLSPSKELEASVALVSPQNIRSATRIFQKKINGNLQSVIELDPELARIIILPVFDSVDIQESANKISAFANEIEYAEPNYIYHIDGVPAPNDSLYDAEWAHRVMRVLDAWQVDKIQKEKDHG